MKKRNLASSVRLQIGNWKLKAGNSKSEIRKSALETGFLPLEFLSLKFRAAPGSPIWARSLPGISACDSLAAAASCAK